MPAEGVAKMNVVALSAREKEIWELLEEIQPGKVALAESLAKKVKNLRLDQIIDLTSHV
ncbi:hypothetical protein H6F77_14210 [Microcoleus sp. FACHB-831]|uniref:hypothetical protein n=1 Tax=Microcoleus sp. FACHB-831 TaxID=2692827 RepID=UPI0016885176|nr:hypothetical protein [Microcoleus sp. FACHB-831]MBD1922233.1 hypothetical protein [Microcoleus sp. FACHB-831]